MFLSTNFFDVTQSLYNKIVRNADETIFITYYIMFFLMGVEAKTSGFTKAQINIQGDSLYSVKYFHQI